MQFYVTAHQLQRTHFSQSRSILKGLKALPRVSIAINFLQPAWAAPIEKKVVVFDGYRGAQGSQEAQRVQPRRGMTRPKPFRPVPKKKLEPQPPQKEEPRVEKSVEKPVEKPVERLVEKPVEKPEKPQPQPSRSENTQALGKPRTARRAARPWKAILAAASTLMVVLAVLTASILFLPNLYYQVFPGDALPVVPEAPGTPLGGSFDNPQPVTHYQPPFDPSLPEGDWIIISRIGVRTELHKTENLNEALEKGVWWVPDFGNPGDLEDPMIVAAHRFGWKWWWNTLTDPNDPESLYALRHSFYNLPTTEPGDQIEIISGQRKYIYEIYAGEEGDEITDYEADLILYTCKFLNSPIRHVRYARLINPTVDTQAVN